MTPVLIDALYRIGALKVGPPIPADVMAQLVELNLVEIADGIPRLTSEGQKRFAEIESGDIRHI